MSRCGLCHHLAHDRFGGIGVHILTPVEKRPPALVARPVAGGGCGVGSVDVHCPDEAFARCGRVVVEPYAGGGAQGSAERGRLGGRADAHRAVEDIADELRPGPDRGHAAGQADPVQGAGPRPVALVRHWREPHRPYLPEQPRAIVPRPAASPVALVAAKVNVSAGKLSAVASKRWAPAVERIRGPRRYRSGLGAERCDRVQGPPYHEAANQSSASAHRSRVALQHVAAWHGVHAGPEAFVGINAWRAGDSHDRCRRAGDDAHLSRCDGAHCEEVALGVGPGTDDGDAGLQAYAERRYSYADLGPGVDKIGEQVARQSQRRDQVVVPRLLLEGVGH